MIIGTYIECRAHGGIRQHQIDFVHGQVGKQVRWRNLRIQTESLVPRDGDFPFVVNTVPNALSAREAQLGWRLAWDGRTTTGWRGASREAFPEVGWRIADGALTVEESGGGEAKRGGDIVTEDEFGAFELQLEFRIAEGANVPVVLGFLDFDNKRLGLGPSVTLTGDQDADMAIIDSFYSSIRGRWPEKATPVRLTR